MTTLGFKFFDCDNHYYEALDAFTRHLEKGYQKRTMQWAQVEGKTRLLVGGKINRFIPNPTFDPVARPGERVTHLLGDQVRVVVDQQHVGHGGTRSRTCCGRKER